jgi:hypothetical protein
MMEVLGVFAVVGWVAAMGVVVVATSEGRLGWLWSWWVVVMVGVLVGQETMYE